MKFRPLTTIARLYVFLAAATVNSIANAEDIVTEASFNSYFSIGLVIQANASFMRKGLLPFF